MIRKIIYAAIAVFVIIQFIPVERDNPAVEGAISAPVEVQAILSRACYDCHSHETKWPWYSYVAPLSLLVAHDVHEGREHLNFSRWQTYAAKFQKHKMEDIWEQVSEGNMPLWFYIPLHPEAKLSDADLATLQAWATAGTAPDSEMEGERESSGEHEGSETDQ